jgi:hypothetical protein
MADFAAPLPKWQPLQTLCHKKSFFASVFLFDKPILHCRISVSPGEKKMLNSFDDVNRILAELADQGTIEPIDDPNMEVNFWDWADVIGIVDEFVPSDDPFWANAF